MGGRALTRGTTGGGGGGGDPTEEEEEQEELDEEKLDENPTPDPYPNPDPNPDETGNPIVDAIVESLDIPSDMLTPALKQQLQKIGTAAAAMLSAMPAGKNRDMVEKFISEGLTESDAAKVKKVAESVDSVSMPLSAVDNTSLMNMRDYVSSSLANADTYGYDSSSLSSLLQSINDEIHSRGY